MLQLYHLIIGISALDPTVPALNKHPPWWPKDTKHLVSNKGPSPQSWMERFKILSEKRLGNLVPGLLL